MPTDAHRPDQIQQETRNGLAQFDAISRLIDEVRGSLNLSAAIVQSLHWEAMRELHDQAGQFRDCGVAIKGASHKPPASSHVAGL